ncbi:TrmH family RNA methyltransferase [Candidatus Parcubacteria bacterium]|nr:TrmH family RNA methyltransferase [Candidatus Parcubacteria bacterium]
MEVVVVLHNVRSAHNVGSIFRTSDAAGVQKIYLTGYTPGLTDPRGKVRKDFVKVSLGAEASVPHSQHKQLTPVLKKLQKEGFEIVAIEQNEKSKSLFDFKPTSKLAVIMGNEVRGISAASLKYANHILEIPMHGAMVRQAHHPRNQGRGKESLNVSVAAGIALFSLTR